MSDARPFRLWNDSQLSRTRVAVETIVTAWSRHWSGSPPEIAVVANRYSAGELGPRSGERQWWVAGGPTDGWVALGRGTGTDEWLERLLAGGLPTGAGGHFTAAITSALFEHCLSDLQKRLVDDNAIENVTSPTRAEMGQLDRQSAEAGAGAVTFRLGNESGALTVVLAGERIARLLGTGAPKRTNETLSARRDAIRDNKVHLLVEAGAVDISLGELGSVKCGDILRLDALFEEPMQVKTGNGVALGPCYLGSIDGRKAIQFGAQ